MNDAERCVVAARAATCTVPNAMAECYSAMWDAVLTPDESSVVIYLDRAKDSLEHAGVPVHVFLEAYLLSSIDGFVAVQREKFLSHCAAKRERALASLSAAADDRDGDDPQYYS